MTVFLVVKALLISALAALAGAWIPTMLLGGPSNAWMAPLFFTVPGAVILSAAYAASRTYRPSGWTNYPFVFLVGGIVGGLMLIWAGLVGVALGAGYGAFTALCWIVLHFAVRRWRTSALVGARAH